MVKITLPATTANFGIGFDTLGMALSLYNVFSFKHSKQYQIIGFDEHVTLTNNLVLSSYVMFAESCLEKDKVKFVEIEQVSSEIPFARGLGSSATCILAGVIGANIINECGKSFDECVDFAAKIEGHPDNIYACAYGGFVSAYLENGKYYYDQYPISKDLQFQLLIPSVIGNTYTLRKVLPSEVPYHDVVHNLSRIVSLPNALLNGDFASLKRILKDHLHEPFRFPHIPKYSLIQAINQSPNTIALISGSGPSVLLIHQQANSMLINQEITDSYQLIDIEIGNKLEVEVLL